MNGPQVLEISKIEIKYHHAKQTRALSEYNNPRFIDTVVLSDVSISGVTNWGTVHLHVQRKYVNQRVLSYGALRAIRN